MESKDEKRLAEADSFDGADTCGGVGRAAVLPPLPLASMTAGSGAGTAASTGPGAPTTATAAATMVGDPAEVEKEFGVLRRALQRIYRECLLPEWEGEKAAFMRLLHNAPVGVFAWKDRNGWYLIHYAAQYSMALNVIVAVTDGMLRVGAGFADSAEEAMRMQNDYGSMPLHCLVQNKNAAMDMIEHVLKLNPQAAMTPNHEGNLPFHLLVHNNVALGRARIRAVLVANPDAASTPGYKSQLPLHKAARNTNMTRTDFAEIFNAFPAAMQVPDAAGDTVLHIAARTYVENTSATTSGREHALENIMMFMLEQDPSVFDNLNDSTLASPRTILQGKPALERLAAAVERARQEEEEQQQMQYSEMPLPQPPPAAPVGGGQGTTTDDTRVYPVGADSTPQVPDTARSVPGPGDAGLSTQPMPTPREPTQRAASAEDQHFVDALRSWIVANVSGIRDASASSYAEELVRHNVTTVARLLRKFQRDSTFLEQVIADEDDRADLEAALANPPAQSSSSS